MFTCSRISQGASWFRSSSSGPSFCHCKGPLLLKPSWLMVPYSQNSQLAKASELKGDILPGCLSELVKDSQQRLLIKGCLLR